MMNERDNPLWRDIMEQASNLRRIRTHLYGPERGAVEQAAASISDGPIALVGMGSAAYLSLPAQYYLGEHGRPASVIYGSDGFYNLLPALKRMNVIVNSRSGATAEIVKVAGALSAAHVPFVALTNEPESVLAQQAAHVVWSNSYKDELVSINIVTAMMMATLVLSAAIVGQMDTLYRHLDPVVDNMQQVVEQAWHQSDTLLSQFETARPIYLLSRGASHGAAYCGRLVLEEVARRPAVALEAAEFRQGSIEVVDEHFAAVLFVPGDTVQRDLTLALAEDIAQNGGRVLLVGGAPSAHRDRIVEFPLPPGLHDAVRPILEVVPVQVLAYRLAQAAGVRPGETRYISKVITSEAGIPRQVQR
jgi:glucosamine--fructose-6-phosphate aminotransferase (isomerizing)